MKSLPILALACLLSGCGALSQADTAYRSSVEQQSFSVDVDGQNKRGGVSTTIVFRDPAAVPVKGGK